MFPKNAQTRSLLKLHSKIFQENKIVKNSSKDFRLGTLGSTTTPRRGVEPRHPEGSRVPVLCNTVMRPGQYKTTERTLFKITDSSNKKQYNHLFPKTIIQSLSVPFASIASINNFLSTFLLGAGLLGPES